jgi:biopolymer transport protein ExbB
MNFRALFLVLMFGAATVFGQEALPADGGVLIAQAAPGKDSAITSINDRGAKDRSAPPMPSAAASGDTTTIPARSAGMPSTSSEGGINMTLWKLIQDGGWAMIPLGFLSVVTVMLVFVYMFTLRRGAILTPHYMNTADVLLKKRDYLGLLAISSRHSEAVARWCNGPWTLRRRTQPLPTRW